ncbi:LysE family transporter [Pseudomonas kuykendallii]|uniref:Threonine/homoserine/homoserine lactone efflux protein n=1 Tax=Pseudomonas kuykendallii TaxID=1007099 RepID=A0A1H3FSF4_9PSED|nr:LysE family transporter [Pseudomonas kuykendallii]MCQ4272288.1 LysE family transporter [Pseudomonas kuykendallii]SDX94003.1 Threonine/homoserine/homoserine lactone efflux protein [Pseudomonas kuykendallii]
MLDALLPLLLFALVSTISPGGATTLATASGANFGWWRSFPLLSGISFGLASMAAAAAAGLGGLILALPSLQLAMKLVGTAYLLWLALQIARRGAPGTAAATEKPSRFLTGVWLLWQNLKAWAMTLSAAASFAALTRGPETLALLLGLVFAVFSLISLAIWCVAGVVLARALKTEAQWRILNMSLGALLVASIVPIWL